MWTSDDKTTFNEGTELRKVHVRRKYLKWNSIWDKTYFGNTWLMKRSVSRIMKTLPWGCHEQAPAKGLSSRLESIVWSREGKWFRSASGGAGMVAFAVLVPASWPSLFSIVILVLLTSFFCRKKKEESEVSRGLFLWCNDAGNRRHSKAVEEVKQS
jgi:hypothetical protein